MNVTAQALQSAVSILNECKARLEETLNCKVDISYTMQSTLEQTTLYALSMDHVLQAVSSVTQIVPTKIKSKSRELHIKNARFIAMKLIFDLSTPNKSAIGKFFNRDHTTVMNAIKKCEEFIVLESDFENLYMQCRAKCKMIQGR